MLAVIIMAAALVGLLSVMPDWAQGAMFWRLLRLMGVAAASAIVYFATLWLVGFRPRHFARSVQVH